jgi:hypothetical protein
MLIDKLRNLREKLSEQDHLIIDWAVMVIQDKLAQNAMIINQEYEDIASRFSSINWNPNEPVNSFYTELEYLFKKSFTLLRIGEGGLDVVRYYVPIIKQSFTTFYGNDDNEPIIKLYQFYKDRHYEFSDKSRNSDEKSSIDYKIASQVYGEICRTLSE